jgi:uncharacterized membrane protein
MNQREDIFSISNLREIQYSLLSSSASHISFIKAVLYMNSRLFVYKTNADRRDMRGAGRDLLSRIQVIQ